MDVGTSFGGIGSSREMMFASLAEPAMLMIVFTLALLAGSTQLSVIAHFMVTNGSLRVSFGTVRGYRPGPGAEEYAPFTTAAEIPNKDTGKQPFDAARPLLDAIAAGKWGPYAAAGLGSVPIDFLSDLDITGGNSGSPVLNARGELVGLAFDGNYEGLASDVVFRGETTRTITADIRYILWVADAIDQADHIVEELGVKPSL